MSETILDYDVVIVGSGAGGGTVAKELSQLCQSGAKVALLEWGGFFEKHDNTRREIEMAGKYYFGHGGVLNIQQDMTYAFAKSVGGSTSVYTGTSIVPGPEVFARWDVPGVDLSDLQPRYDKYIRENNVHLYPEDELNDNNKLFYQGCKKLGWSASQFPVNTRGCAGLATCNTGCAIHAKQGTAAVQIPAAVKNGVELIPFCRADRIESNAVIAEVIPPEHGLKASPLKPGRYRFRAKKIVLSGGVMNTTPLLMRSFGKDFLPAIGRYFTCHPALILVGQQPQPIRVTSGHPKSFYCDHFHESDRFILETCFYFPFTLAKNLSGYGDDVDDLIAHYQQLQMILVLALDEAEAHNRITIDGKGERLVDYTFNEKTLRSFVTAIRASAKIFFAAGAERVHAPAARDFFIQAKDADHIDDLVTRERFKLGKVSISAAHLMGGCRIGLDPKTSVTDPWGRVHGKKDLYVADASLFPAASEVNPYLTVMALSDRVAEAVRHDLKGPSL